MTSGFILQDKVEEMVDNDCSYGEIMLECEKIRNTWTLWWRIKRCLIK